MLKTLIDPSAGLVRTAPNNEQDLLIGAQNGMILAYDNLSGIRQNLSDSLCRLCTKGGFSTRTLFTDAEESIIEASRPVIINGIDYLVNRGDLANRAITCELQPIETDNRTTENALWKRFEKDHPKILGAICDAVSTGLKYKDQVSLENLPRMADFASWVFAAEPALPWEKGEFLRLYNKTQEDMDEEIIENSPVGKALIELLDAKAPGLEGITSGELLDRLSDLAPDVTRTSQYWPKTATALARELARLKPTLRKKKIIVENVRTKNKRALNIIDNRDSQEFFSH